MSSFCFFFFSDLDSLASFSFSCQVVVGAEGFQPQDQFLPSLCFTGLAYSCLGQKPPSGGEESNLDWVFIILPRSRKRNPSPPTKQQELFCPFSGWKE